VSQKAEVLRYLKTGRTLTADEAKRWFGCARLTSRIGELEEDGYEFERPLIKVGPRTYVSQYKLIMKDKQLELNLR